MSPNKLFGNFFGNSKVTTRPENPYVTGNVVGGGPAFIGRADILREVDNILRHSQQNAIVLFGQRRIGKTSVLKELATKLPNQGNYRTIFFDLLGKAHQPLATILEELADTVSQTLKQAKPQLDGEHAKQQFREWLSRLLTETEFLPISFVFLLDEFDDALNDTQVEQTKNAFFHYLREDLLPTDPKRLNFIFAIGRNISDLNQIGQALFRTILTQRVSLLTQADTINLIRLSERNQSLFWSKPAIDKIWELTHGHPYLTQLLCFCVWERVWNALPLPSRVPTVTTSQAVESVIPEVLEKGVSALEWLWNGLPAECKIVAAGLAGDKVISKDQLTKRLYENGIHTVIAELDTAPQVLKEWDIVEECPHGYCFRVELLRRWIVEHKPLNTIMQQEVGRIRIEADQAYQAGLSLYKSQHWEDACQQLSIAIRLNPNHIEAHQLLAKVRVENGNVAEAITGLQELYKYQPAVARPQLTEILWRQVQETGMGRETQLQLCSQILGYDPNHVSATKKIGEIWKGRGEKAYREEDWEGALAAYQQALNTYLLETIKTEIAKVKKTLFLRRQLEPILYGVVFVLSLVGFYWLWPVESKSIVLEMDNPTIETGAVSYSFKGISGNEDNSLDSLTVSFQSPYSNAVKQAIYNEQPIENKLVHPNYQYVLTDPQTGGLKFSSHSSFTLKIPSNEVKNLSFKCEVKTNQPSSVCEVKPSGYSSLVRGIPWWIWGSLVGIFGIVVIKLVFLFINRKPRRVF